MSTRLRVEEHILSANESLAVEGRARLDRAGVFALNLMASPGAGKTSLILQTIDWLRDDVRIGVVDGDVAEVDVDRIAAMGVPVALINTGGACHLDANMLLSALDEVPLNDLDLLIVENVGNLICPANFALGVHMKVVIASVPEGDDKPYKYPAMFRGADVLLLNKVDVLRYESFDTDYFRRGVETLNPGLTFFPVSCKIGEGIEAWTNWLRLQATS